MNAQSPNMELKNEFPNLVLIRVGEIRIGEEHLLFQMYEGAAVQF